MNILQQIFNLLQQTIIIAPPILITSVGACISEKSGVINIGLEGIMLSSKSLFRNNFWSDSRSFDFTNSCGNQY